MGIGIGDEMQIAHPTVHQTDVSDVTYPQLIGCQRDKPTDEVCNKRHICIWELRPNSTFYEGVVKES
ncbi:MAG: hypothetical protein LUI85_20200 [Bacteroides sp.]|nr:hypothetical protein [Bacteroides sp.]